MLQFLCAVLHLKVITSKDERMTIVRSVHDGLGTTAEAEALGGHIGRDKTVSKILERLHCLKYRISIVKLIMKKIC
jgi:hypothetical protein